MGGEIDGWTEVWTDRRDGYNIPCILQDIVPFLLTSYNLKKLQNLQKQSEGTADHLHLLFFLYFILNLELSIPDNMWLKRDRRDRRI